MILASDPETLNTAWLFLAGVIVCVAVSKADKRAGTGKRRAAAPRDAQRRKTRRNGEDEPYRVEEMMLYDWIFGDD